MASEINPLADEPGRKLSCCDLGIALERMDGANDLLVEVIGVYLDDYPNSLRELKSAAAAGLVVELQRAAHTVKGAASNFVATPCTDVAFEIERLAQEGFMDQAVARVPALETELIRLAAALADYRDRQEAA